MTQVMGNCFDHSTGRKELPSTPLRGLSLFVASLFFFFSPRRDNNVVPTGDTFGHPPFCVKVRDWMSTLFPFFLFSLVVGRKETRAPCFSARGDEVRVFQAFYRKRFKFPFSFSLARVGLKGPFGLWKLIDRGGVFLFPGKGEALFSRLPFAPLL